MAACGRTSPHEGSERAGVPVRADPSVRGLRGPGGCSPHPPWGGGNPGVYARGHPGGCQGNDLPGNEGDRRPNRAGQHVSSAFKARCRPDPEGRGPPWLYGLGQAHPYGFGRLSGVLPGRPAENHRRGCSFPQPSGWLADGHGSGGVRPDPGNAGCGHHHGL